MAASLDTMQNLMEKISSLPREQVAEIVNFVDFLRFRQMKNQQRKHRMPGCWAGKIWIADDFDAPLPDDMLAAFYGEVA